MNPSKQVVMSQTDEIFTDVKLMGSRGDFEIYVNLLKRYGDTKALSAGKRVHEVIIQSGHALELFLENHLVQMYSRCRALDDARAVFACMPQRNVFSWNLIIGAYVQNAESEESFGLFQQMYSEGPPPDKVTFVTLLSACADRISQSEGKWIHDQIVHRGFESDVVVGTNLVNMYGKCGSLAEARMTFDKMPDRNVVSWNAIIAIYAQYEQLKSVKGLLQRMQLESVIPDRVSFVSTLSACTNLDALLEAERLHVSVVGSSLESDVVIGNALINLYGKCANMEDAGIIFHKMPTRNLISWNAMIGACAQLHQVKAALNLFSRMQLEGIMPDWISFSSVLSTFSSEATQSEGKRMHARIVGCACEPDLVVVTAIISMYGKCCIVKDARMMFDEMAYRNVAVWNAMTMAYTQHGQTEEAIELFQKMHLDGLIPDTVTFVTVLSACASQAAFTQGKRIHDLIVTSGWEANFVVVENALINMYGKCGSLRDACYIFDRMPVRNVVSWSAMIAACAELGQYKEALDIFKQMLLADFIPDKVAFLSILSVCANHAALVEAMLIHACILITGCEMDVTVRTALVNMYSKCGSLEDSKSIFYQILLRTAVSWNTIIAAYAQHGLGREAIELSSQMQYEGFIPDNVTFFGLLSACSHSGLVEEGRCYFVSMARDYDITPTVEHFNCMIDLLGRAGLLEQVDDLIKNMELQPSGLSWMILLCACRVHLDMERGKHAAKQIMNCKPSNATASMLSNVYAVNTDSEWGASVEDHGFEGSLNHYCGWQG